MKQLLLPILALLALPATAQFATLRTPAGEVVNGGLVIHYGDNVTPDQEVDVDVILQGSTTRIVNVRRYELTVDPNTQNYFCWGVCYIPLDAGTLPMWQAQSQHALTLEPGVAVSNFHAYHSPQGVIGTSTYRYVWFDVNSPSDTAWVDIQFRVTAVGIADRALEAQLSVYPNPVVGNDAVLTYSVPGSLEGTTVILRNTLGAPVRTQALRAATGQHTLSLAGLPSGVYFATLERQGRILTTRRVVVSH